MEKTNCEYGGSVITWKIENFQCLDNELLYSPYFFVGTTNKIRWRLYLDRSTSYFFFLEKVSTYTSTNISVSYSSSISTDDSKDTDNRFGILPYTSKLAPTQILESIGESDINTSAKNMIFRCCLRIVSDNNLIVNQYKFRSVFQVEHRRLQYTIPNIRTTGKKIFIPTPLACSLTVPFEMSLCPSGSNNTLDLDITNTSEDRSNDVFLICKLSAADEKRKHLFKATHEYEFKKGKTNVWRFPTPINIKDSQSNNSVKDILSLDFELWVSEHKSNTWIEGFCDETISQTKVAFENYEKDKAKLRDDFMCLYVQRKFPDLEIIAGGKKLPAHKDVLCARSPVFRAMFENNMLEKEKNVVEISDIDPETVDKLLFFMYSELLQDREWSNVAKLYGASDRYQIMTLKDKCSSILKEQLSVQNTCEALQLADMHCDYDFQNSILDFVFRNANKVFQSEEWKEFMKINSKMACLTMHKAWLQRMEE